ncbi:hypothetical protein [Schlesneria paludicola]|uniref:hypothetical protein n=1 Tax=Schlesneria paludicola TaxID=360056 RepID=UPI0012FCF5E3|nr:hypothetical protein [Schlesneria paludicola]
MAVREFFKGWKRNVGVVTLLMACLFMSGWVRSGRLSDFVQLPGTRKCHCTLASFGGCFRVLWTSPSHNLGWHWTSDDLSHLRGFKIGPNGKQEFHDTWEGYNIERRMDWGDFKFGVAVLPGDGARKTVRIEAYQIPYWSIVVPMTLFSAYLLLSKPIVIKPIPENRPA